MKRKYYIAYGSNLNKDQMQRRCPLAKPLGSAELKGYKLVFRRGYLTIEPDTKSTVPVGIWGITEGDEAALDRYEGYPDFYYKVLLPIEYKGDVIHCMVYIMNNGHPIKAPTVVYMKTVIRGYNDFKIDRKRQYDLFAAYYDSLENAE